MTNPDNIVRVRARNGGRASVYEANGWAQAYTFGLIEGNGVIQNTSADMNVLVGGSQAKPDVILATNPSGYKIALDIVGQQAIAITAPATNSRISSIVAYTDDLSLGTTEDTVTGSPSSCGLIVVNGTASSNPTAPDDTDIRSAITADGATGSQAAYCVIATILVESSTTIITNSLITNNIAQIGSKSFDSTTIIPETASTEIDTGIKFNGKTVYAQRFTGSSSFTNGTRKEVDLATCSDRPVILQTFGWFTAGDYATSSTSSVPFLAGVSSVGGYVVVIGVVNDKKIKLRVLPASTGTYNWDFVVFYYKD